MICSPPTHRDNKMNQHTFYSLNAKCPKLFLQNKKITHPIHHVLKCPIRGKTKRVNNAIFLSQNTVHANKFITINLHTNSQFLLYSLQESKVYIWTCWCWPAWMFPICQCPPILFIILKIPIFSQTYCFIELQPARTL